jgi:hypothetical protein
LEEKMKYENKVQEEKLEKQASLKELFATSNLEEVKTLRSQLTQKRIERREELKRFRIKRERVKFNKPKLPTTAFSLYLQRLDRGDAGVVDFMRGAALKWNALAVQDKEVYVEEARELKAEYSAKMPEWESRMIEAGRVHLVRKSYRPKLKLKAKTANNLSEYQEKQKANAQKRALVLRKKAAQLLKKVKAERRVLDKVNREYRSKTQSAREKYAKLLKSVKDEMIAKKTAKKMSKASVVKLEKYMSILRCDDMWM